MKEKHKQKHIDPSTVNVFSCDFFSWQQQEVSDPPCWSVKPSSAWIPDRGGRGRLRAPDWAQKDPREHHTTSGQEQGHSSTKSQSTGGFSQSRWGCIYIWSTLITLCYILCFIIVCFFFSHLKKNVLPWSVLIQTAVVVPNTWLDGSLQAFLLLQLHLL